MKFTVNKDLNLNQLKREIELTGASNVVLTKRLNELEVLGTGLDIAKIMPVLATHVPSDPPVNPNPESPKQAYSKLSTDTQKIDYIAKHLGLM